MKIYLALLICVITLPVIATAQQQSPFRGAEERFRDAEGNLDYLSPLQYLIENVQAFDKNAYRQALATYYSFVGETGQAQRGAGKASADSLKLADPYRIIMPRARAASVVLINEAHDTPAHRAFATAMLDSLYAAGYTVLSLEALSEKDTAINSRKFPVSATGFYTREPTYGNLIRTAEAIGYMVVGHEIRMAQEKEISDWQARSNYRDSIQAVNLLAILQKHPKAKVLGYVGYDHILEKELDGLKRMAAYLKDLGAVDALTIDQTTDCNCMGSTRSHPAVLTSDGATPVTTGFKKGYMDIQVVHPPETMVNGRPGWLVSSTGGKVLHKSIPKAYRNKKCLVQVYSKPEFDTFGKQAIPVDQFIVSPGQKRLSIVTPASVGEVLVKYAVVGF